jgi:hypothetical protein
VRPRLERLESRDLPSGFGSLVQVTGPLSPWQNTNADNVNSQPGTAHVPSAVEPSLAVDPTNPQHLVAAWQQDRWTNGGARGIMTAVSTNGGNTWTEVPVPGLTLTTGGNFQRASDPWVAFAPNGDVYVSSVLSQVDPVRQPQVVIGLAIYVNKSTDGGMSWQNPSVIIDDSFNSSTYRYSDGSYKYFDDKESITVDPANPNNVYVVWDRNVLPQNFSNADETPAPTIISRSTTGGQTWSAPAPLLVNGHDYDPSGGTVGNQIVVLPNGTLVNFAVVTDNNTGDSEIVALRSTDQGATWSAPIKVADELNNFVKDPNNPTHFLVRSGIGLPAVAVDHQSGNIYVVWEDLRFSGSANIPQIALSMSTTFGNTWNMLPTKINQTPTNIPTDDQQAFTPSVAVNASGEVAVSYYDFRNSAGALDALTDRWIVFGNPAQGIPFGSEERLTPSSFNIELAPGVDNPSNDPSIIGGYFLGDYEGLVAGGASFNTFGSFFGEAALTSNSSNMVFVGAVSALEPHATLLIDSGGNLSYTPSYYTPGQTVVSNLTVDASGTQYSFTNTAEPIVLDGAGAAGWTGSGTNTVSGPKSSVASMNLRLSNQQTTLVLADAFCPTSISDLFVPASSSPDTIFLGDEPGTEGGTAQNLTGLVTISNLAEGSVVVLYDVNDPAARTVTVTNNSIMGLTPGGVDYSGQLGPFAYSLELLCGQPTDMVNIPSTEWTTLVYASSGAADVTIGNGGSLQGIQGTVNVDCFGSSPGSLLIADESDTNRTVTSTYVSFSSSVGPPLQSTAVDISGLAPADISYELWQSPQPFGNQIQNANLSVTVDLGQNDSFTGLTTNVTLTVNAVGGDTMILAPLPAGATLTAPAAPVTLIADNGSNTIQVQASTAPVAVQGFSSTTTFVIGDANRTLDQIQAMITVTGAGNDNLILNDQGASSGQTYTIRQGYFDRAGTAAISYGGIANVTKNLAPGSTLNIGQTGQAPMSLPLDPIVINTSTGNNTINIFSTWAPLTINGQGGTDSAFIGNQGSLAGILAPVSLSNTGGTTALTVDDSADPVAQMATLAIGSLSGLAPALISWAPPNPCTPLSILGGTGGNTFTVESSNTQTLLTPGTGNDAVYVQAVTAPITINAQQSDSITIGNNGTLAGIAAPVTVNTAGSGPVVTLASPNLTTTASGAVTFGTIAPTLTDAAVLSGGYFETGTITFVLTGPAGFSFTTTDTVNGNGTYTAGDILPTMGTAAGTYTWSAVYSGDSNNYSAPDQGGTAEQTAVSLAATLNIDPSGNLSYLPSEGVQTVLTVDAAGGQYSFNNTGEQIILSGDAVALGWTGSGTNTVSGPISSVASMNLYLSDQPSTLELADAFCPTFISDLFAPTTSAPANIFIGDPNDQTGTAQNVLGPTTISNLAANSFVEITDSADQTARAVTVTNSSIIGLAPGGVQYSGLGAGSEIGLVCGSQATDTVSILSTAANLTTVVARSANTIVGNAGTLLGIQGDVRIDSFRAQGSLTVDDSADTIDRTITSSFVNFPQTNISFQNSAVIISNLAPASIRYDVAAFVNNQTFNANLNVTVFLGSNASFTGLTTNVGMKVIATGGGDAMTLAPLPAGAMLTAPAAPVEFSAPRGSDQINIQASASAVTIDHAGGDNSQPQTSTITIGDANTTLDQIQGPITIDGLYDNLTLNDQGASSGQTYDVTSSTIKRGGSANIDYSGLLNLALNQSNGASILIDDGADIVARNAIIANNTLAGLLPPPILGYFTISWDTAPSTVTIDGGSGGNTFDIENLGAGIPVTLNAGSGSNLVTIAATAEVLDGLESSLTVNTGGTGSTLVVHDELATALTRYTIAAQSIAISRPGLAASIGYSGFQDVAVHGGSASLPRNLFVVDSTLATTLSTALYGGTGASTTQFIVIGAGNDLDGIQGPVALHGNAASGLDFAEVYDAGNTVGHTYTLTNGLVQRDGIANITYDGMDFISLLAPDNVSFPPVQATVNVESATTTTAVAAGSQTTVTLGMPTSGGGHTLQTLQATVQVASIGANETPKLVIDDSGDPNSAPRTVTLDNAGAQGYGITGLSPAPIDILLDPTASVSILGDAGNETFDVNTLPPLATTIKGQGTGNSLAVHDELSTAVTSYTVAASGITVSRPGLAASIGYSGIQNVALYGGNPQNGGDGYGIYSTLATTLSTAVYAGGSVDNEFIVENAGNSLDDIQGPVALHGAGLDGLEVFDAGNIASHTYTLTSGLVQRDHMANITYDGMLSVVLAAPDNPYFPSGPATVNLESDNTITVVAVGSKATVTLGMPTAGNGHNLQTLLAAVRVQSLIGRDETPTLIVDDSGDPSTAARTVTLSTDPSNGYSITGLSPAPIYALFDPTATVSILGDGGNETFQVNTLPAFAMTVDGQGGNNTLAGPNQANTWQITGSNSGVLDSVFAFKNIENLTGGVGNDTFAFQTAGSLSGKIDGGTGTNTLDYSAFVGNIKVNLALSAATAAGGVANIEDVTGSQGNDLLVGNAQALVLQGGTGRNLIIADHAAATLTGGPGDDILIGGYTDYDTNAAALDALLGAWESTTQSYTQRIAVIQKGVAYSGGTAQLTNKTVHSNGLVDTLTGGYGQDWFFAAAADIITDLNLFAPGQKKGETVTTIK